MLDLEENLLTGIDGQWFASMSETLELLYIQSNRLQNIDENAFEHLRSVTIADLGQNPGIRLPSNVFRTMTSLSRLYLDDNRINEIDPTWFNGLNRLSYVTFNKNNIEDLQPGVFR